jgi:hypothetical protein
VTYKAQFMAQECIYPFIKVKRDKKALGTIALREKCVYGCSIYIYLPDRKEAAPLFSFLIYHLIQEVSSSVK